MKEQELRKHANCSICKLPVGYTQLPLFWTVALSRHMIDMKAMQRQDGLAMFLGSNKLAQVMGVDPDMTELVIGPIELTVCEKCVFDGVRLARLIELAWEGEDGN